MKSSDAVPTKFGQLQTKRGEIIETVGRLLETPLKELEADPATLAQIAIWREGVNLDEAEGHVAESDNLQISSPIGATQLTAKVVNALEAANIDTVGTLLEYDLASLAAVKGVGGASLGAIAIERERIMEIFEQRMETPTEDDDGLHGDERYDLEEPEQRTRDGKEYTTHLQFRFAEWVEECAAGMGWDTGQVINWCVRQACQRDPYKGGRLGGSVKKDDFVGDVQQHFRNR